MLCYMNLIIFYVDYFIYSILKAKRASLNN